MKKRMENKKGFTLVELLAVIVVLAIIILIAMPSVMGAMDKARRNSLVTEASEIAKIAQTAYADDSANGTGIKAICYNLEYLVENGYMDKKLGNDYKGGVLLVVDDSTGKVTTKINLTNGVYSIKDKDPKTVDASKLSGDVNIDNNCGGFSGVTNYNKKCGKTGNC